MNQAINTEIYARDTNNMQFSMELVYFDEISI